MADDIVSIHAPHTGSDLPVWVGYTPHMPVSIHAPHTGSDTRFAASSTRLREFQSTLPTRGATISCCNR